MSRRRGALSVLVAVVLVLGLVPRSVSALWDRDPNPRVVHPAVTDGSGYLNNGYADGARLLTLPGNMVGLSADGTVAATRSSGGQVKGYRLSDGQVAWEVSADLVASCPFFENPEGYLWSPLDSPSGVLECQRETESRPFGALSLLTGRWTDFGFLSQHPEFNYGGLDDRFIYVTVLGESSGETRFVSLDYDGREVSSVRLQVPTEASQKFAGVKVCWMDEGTIMCDDREDQYWLFDATTGALERTIQTPGSFLLTADGYAVRRGDGYVLDFYDQSGEWLGSTDKGSYCYTPARGVAYPNADYLNTPRDCMFSLVGPSGRVFAERSRGESVCLLPQAGRRVECRASNRVRGFISHDERVIALLAQDNSSRSSHGAQLIDAHTGRLIARFPVPWAFVQNGIIFWTSNDWDPDNLLGTQVLVPGAT